MRALLFNFFETQNHTSVTNSVSVREHPNWHDCARLRHFGCNQTQLETLYVPYDFFIWCHVIWRTLLHLCLCHSRRRR